jgi:sigma-54 specific flagellar transcriptional regulator A
VSIVGSSASTLRLNSLIGSVAPTDASVLIRGESGCGKELYAREIHNRSNRFEKKFIAINCGAIPHELLESQLFGHKKGAFTGAISDFKGKFEEAQGGTLFLDEIGDMPFDMQVKLLRVLQEKNLTPIGSHQIIDIDVRIIAATHQNIEGAIEAKEFRQDLFFRLNVVPLLIPPLRERASEIPELIEYFSLVHADPKRGPLKWSENFMSKLHAYDWPGNVRELGNMVHRLSILYPGQMLKLDQIDPTMLPGDIFGAEDITGSSTRLAQESEKVVNSDLESGENEFEDIILQAQGFGGAEFQALSLKETLSRVEEDLISKALEQSDGNVSRCAKLLRMQRTTLIERIKKLSIKTA